MHVYESGQVDNVADSEEEAFEQIKQFLSYLPNTTNEVPDRIETGDPPDRRPEELLNIIPPNRKRSYDPRKRALIASYEAEVPKVEFNVRKSYGVAADAPNSLGHPNGLNLRYGWPAGEWGGIPIEGGVAAAYRREIENAPDPEAHRSMIENRLLKLRSPFRAAYKGDVVDLIDPRDTRKLACRFVKLAQPLLHKLAQRPKRIVRP